MDEPDGAMALDASGKGNHGRITGGAERVAGRFGTGLRLNGSDGCVEMAGLGRLPVGSVEAWVRLETEPTGQGSVVSFCAGNKGRGDFALLGFPSHLKGSARNAFAFSIYRDEWHAATSDIVPAVGTWYHLAATWDGSGMRCYVNGALRGENTACTGGIAPHAAILIGAGSWSTYAPCTVDEVRVHRRVLTEPEMEAHASRADYVAVPPQPAGRTVGIPEDAVLNVADFYSAGSPTSGIQDAIDALPIRGGVVVLPPGEYLLTQSVFPTNNVTLRGSGGSSVLRKCPEIQTAMAEATPKGSTTLKVTDPAGFEVGMQICITSKGLGGWYCSQPVITRVEGSILSLSEPLEKGYDPASSIVINYFPAIWIETRRQVTIEAITIDGDIALNPGPFSDFVCAAIHCFRSTGVRIRDCTIRDWPCDGIGVQSGTRAFVTSCEASGCRGHGVHPGTSLHHATFSDIISHHNAWNGLYFCMNVRYINVTNGVFYENGRHGIGGIGGGKMPGRDQYNVVANNTCESNAMCGIQVIQGNHNIVTNNVCRNNSQAQPGVLPGILIQSSEDIVVTGNLCTDEREPLEKRQVHGIAETGTSNHNIITGNNCRGNAKSGVVTVGKNTVTANNVE
ncbi:MAG: hypothetical protein HON70_08055 [Lentisphaerae bacterium]|nr:hypothetical protein [Lentisphaerota bacterium]